MKASLQLGIIGGEEKRSLECYFDSRYFNQRKSYDEYYVDAPQEIEIALAMNDLMIISEAFKVRVLPDGIVISDY